MYSINWEQEYIYNNTKYVVCCTVDFKVNKPLPATGDWPEEDPETIVESWTVEAIYLPTLDGKLDKYLLESSELYDNITTEFVLDTDWYVDNPELEKAMLKEYKSNTGES